jgi:hypothetical protein
MSKEEKKERKKPRHRGAQSRANSDIETHIHSLGLETVTQYQEWCRKNGFSGALNKVYSERHKERLLAQKQREEAKALAEVEEYIRYFGHTSVKQYQEWCRANHLSDALHKSPKQRQREQDLANLQHAQAALNKSRQKTQNPQATLCQIIAGTVPVRELKSPELLRVHQICTLAREEKAHVVEAFRRLLLHCDLHARFESDQPAIPIYEESLANTWQYGLLNLARYWKFWVRSPEDWKPDTHNPRRQFRSLSRHLLAQYGVPDCMDSVWFLEPSPQALQRQGLFLHVGSGQNIRRGDLPLTLTKRMAHLFLQASPNYTLEEALRWAQVVGMGGSEGMARAVLKTFLGDMTTQEPFWATVLLFFAQNPMLDPDQIAPILAYIQDQKFTCQPVTLPDGSRALAPPSPDFAMKGRTVPALLERVERHQRALQREVRHLGHIWEPSGIGEFSCQLWVPAQQTYWRWTIQELRTSQALRQEGRAQSHCVASYAGSCRKGNTSIWSLQVQCGEDMPPLRVLTIAVNNRDKRINQVRGKHNAHPHYQAHNAEEQKVKRKMQSLFTEGRNIMLRWARQEGMVVSPNA